MSFRFPLAACRPDKEALFSLRAPAPDSFVEVRTSKLDPLEAATTKEADGLVVLRGDPRFLSVAVPVCNNEGLDRTGVEGAGEAAGVDRGRVAAGVE